MWDFKQYQSYSTKALVSKIHNWTVEPYKTQFLLYFDLSYQWEGKEYQKKLAFTVSPYRNRWAAEQAAPELLRKTKEVWIQRNAPHNAVLQRDFPTGSLVSTLCLLALLIYFLWLGYYVGGIT